MPTANGTIHRITPPKRVYSLKPVGDVVLLRRFDNLDESALELPESVKATMREETALCYVEAISDEPLSEGKTRTYKVGDLVLVNPNGCNRAWLVNVMPDEFVLASHTSILFVVTEKIA